jgi:hypothetical protein
MIYIRHKEIRCNCTNLYRTLPLTHSTIGKERDYNKQTGPKYMMLFLKLRFNLITTKRGPTNHIPMTIHTIQMFSRKYYDEMMI